MLVFQERGKPEFPEKTSRCRVENQQTQPTFDAGPGNRTRPTLVRGECSHHCAIPASFLDAAPSEKIMTARDLLNNSILFCSFLLFVLVTVPAFCKLPRVTGPCRAAFPRWYFNKITRKCELFTYGGCRGNRNNFKTRKECEKKCGRCKSE